MSLCTLMKKDLVQTGSRDLVDHHVDSMWLSGNLPIYYF